MTWRDNYADQNLRMAQKMLEQQGEINALKAERDEAQRRIKEALGEVSNIDGAHHKQWIIDQMLRALTGCPIVTRESRDKSYTYPARGESEEYLTFIRKYEDADEDGDPQYTWDEGITP